jgi:hypothetical protein
MCIPMSKHYSGADPGFQVRGGALKKIAPSRGRRENCWGISCEKSRFYAKKIIFFPIVYRLLFQEVGNITTTYNC